MSCFRQKQHNVSFLGMKKKAIVCVADAQREMPLLTRPRLCYSFSFFLFSDTPPHAVLTRNLKKMPTISLFPLLSCHIHCYVCVCYGSFQHHPDCYLACFLLCEDINCVGRRNYLPPLKCRLSGFSVMGEKDLLFFAYAKRIESD
jgi:hypothetical protein